MGIGAAVKVIDTEKASEVRAPLRTIRVNFRAMGEAAISPFVIVRFDFDGKVNSLKSTALVQGLSNPACWCVHVQTYVNP